MHCETLHFKAQTDQEKSRENPDTGPSVREEEWPSRVSATIRTPQPWPHPAQNQIPGFKAHVYIRKSGDNFCKFCTR